MRIMIDALSARFGGGITYMHYMPQAIHHCDPNNEYFVLVSSHYQQAIIEDLPSPWKIIDASLSGEDFLQRWWYLQKVV